MHFAQATVCFQRIEITMHGHLGHAQNLDEILHLRRAVLDQHLQDVVLTFDGRQGFSRHGAPQLHG
jgi:hypothetical protein